MSRFSAREFAFLCVPVALMAGAALFLARRPAVKPVQPFEPLHLKFQVEEATVLEAFQGADAALVARIDGTGAPELRMDSAKTQATLELKNADGVNTISAQSWSSSNPMAGVWKGTIYNEDALRLPVNAMSIPDGALQFQLETQPENRLTAGGVTKPMPLLESSWKLDRAQFQPFDFSALARPPLVRVRSVKITSVAPSNIAGVITLDLLGAAMDAQTPIERSLSALVAMKGATYSGSHSVATPDPKNPLQRSIKWDLTGPTPMPAGVKGDVNGRISVAGRWPLAFQVEPVNFAKVKSGQTLKFQQWPVAAPTTSKTSRATPSS